MKININSPSSLMATFMASTMALMTMMNVVEATTVTSVHLYDIIRIKHTFAGSVLMDHNNDGIYAEVYDTGFENDGAMWIVESSGTASKYMLRNSATDNYMKVTWIGYRWNVETATKIENDESFYWSVDSQGRLINTHGSSDSSYGDFPGGGCCAKIDADLPDTLIKCKSCDHKKTAMEIEIVQTMVGLNEVVTTANEYILVEYPDEIGHTAAQKYCESAFGTNLATITSFADNQKVSDLCSQSQYINTATADDRQCWIGLDNYILPNYSTRQHVEIDGVHEWTSGEPFAFDPANYYSNWMDSAYDNGNYEGADGGESYTSRTAGVYMTSTGSGTGSYNGTWRWGRSYWQYPNFVCDR